MADDLRLSPSKLEMLARCGIAYDYRYNQGIKVPPSVAMLEGRAIDQAASFALQSRLDHGKLPEDGAVAAMAADRMTAEWSDAGEVSLRPDQAAGGGNGALGRAKDRAVRMARKYRTAIAPLIRVMTDPKTGLSRIQHKWELQMGDVVLNGISDNEEADAVNDTKSQANPSRASAADESPQLTYYAAAKYAIDGVENPKVRLHIIVDRPKLLEGVVPGDSPVGVTEQILESVRTVPQMNAALQRADAAAKVIRAGSFMPARPEDWWCSASFCGFSAQCKFFHRPVSVTVPNMDADEGRLDEA